MDIVLSFKKFNQGHLGGRALYKDGGLGSSWILTSADSKIAEFLRWNRIAPGQRPSLNVL